MSATRTRESRRERLRRVSALPDSHIRINWEKIIVGSIVILGLSATLMMFLVMVVMFNDALAL